MSNSALNWAWALRFDTAGGVNKQTLKLVLLKLADQANDDGECWPSQRTICLDTGTSKASLNRALAALEAEGFLVRERRQTADGRRTSTKYHLQMPHVSSVRPGEASHVSPDDTTLSHSRDLGHVSPGETQTLSSFEPSDNPQGVRANSLTVVTPNGTRSRNPAWDGFAQVFGYSPRSGGEQKLWGKLTKQLNDLSVTPETVVECARRHRLEMPGATLTPTSLAKHYERLMATSHSPPTTPAQRAWQKAQQLKEEGR
jgi:hypothetical protein